MLSVLAAAVVFAVDVAPPLLVFMCRVVPVTVDADIFAAAVAAVAADVAVAVGCSCS